MEFKDFGKVKRLFRDIIITEKLDGTNAQIYITYANDIGVEGLSPADPEAKIQMEYALGFKDGMAIYAGSRNRFLVPGKEDNYGFASWVKGNQEELFGLGEGRHFGEWWGKGIQRNYNLEEKKFSLFNTEKWLDDFIRPKCCGIVPVLYKGVMDTNIIHQQLMNLKTNGSVAAPGFDNPEGVIVYHTQSNHLYKYTFEDSHKSQIN